VAAVVIAAAVSTAVEIGVGVVFGDLILSEIAFSVVAKTFAKHFVLNALSAALRGDGNGPNGPPPLTAEARDRKQSIRSATSVRKFVYGRARVSGTLVYAGTTGSTKDKLWLVMPFHHGEYDAVEQTWLNDLQITDARFTGKAANTTYLGTSGQTADSALDTATADWTSDHRLRGIGYWRGELTYDATAFPTGIPNPSLTIRGRKVYDPRTATTAWSRNSALCILDYLIGTVPINGGTEPIGIGATLDEIDLDSFIAAANICDENVALAAGGTHKRYTCDGTVSTDTAPSAVLETMLTSCAGSLVYSAGTYRLFVGAARATSFTLTAGMLRGALKYRPRPSLRTIFNTARGTFIDPDNYYEAADIVPQSVAAYVTEDGGEVIPQDFQLSFTQNGIRGQRLLKQYLQKQRLGRATIEAPCNWSALNIAIMDTGTVDIDLGPGMPDKWIVTDWRLAEGGGINLTLQAEDDDAYTWTTADEATIAASPRPNMERSTDVPDITGLTVDSASYIGDGGFALGALAIDWDDAASVFVNAYDIQVRENGTTPWTVSASSLTSGTTVYGLTIGTAYDVRVRCRRSNGVEGAWNQVDNTTVAGDTTAPAAPSGVSATALTGAIRINWTNPADSDFRKARLYRNTVNDSSTASLVTDIYGFASDADTYTDTVTTGATRYYWLKAQDMSGNASAFSSGVSATAL
jgi:hypothetical protein